MHKVTGVPGGSATPPIATSAVVMRLPSWFELSKRKNSSTAVAISAGSARSRAAQLWLVPGADHVKSFKTDAQGYWDHVLPFLDSALN